MRRKGDGLRKRVTLKAIGRPRTTCQNQFLALVDHLVTRSRDPKCPRFHAGVRQVWVVYPVTSKVQVYESPTRVKILQVGDDLQGDPLIPGFRLPLSVFFGESTGKGS